MTPSLPKELLTLLGPDRIWPGNVSLNGNILNCEDDQTGEDLMIPLICHRHRQSLKRYPQGNYSITFKLGVSNHKTSLIDFRLPCLTSQVSPSPMLFFIDYSFSSFIPVTFYLSWQPSSSFSCVCLLFIHHLHLCCSFFFLFNLTFDIYLYKLFIFK